MRIMTKLAAAVALSAAVAAAATPGFAQRAEEGVSGSRAKALRECNTEANKYTQHSWGDVQIDRYRACMTDRGQQE
jgi:hypothetical protein